MNSYEGQVKKTKVTNSENTAAAGFFTVIIVSLQCWLSPDWS